MGARDAKPRENPLEWIQGNAQTRKAAKRKTTLDDKLFVVWDGEGARTERPRAPQDYILLGYYDGSEHRYVTSKRLTTSECLAFIIEAGRAHPGAWHVGFAFGYDTNMILRNLSTRQFMRLRTRGYVIVFDEGKRYRVEHIQGKRLTVTLYGADFPGNRKDKFTVTIYDIWGFFQSSFVAAIKSYLPTHPLMVHLPQIEAGKADRKGFTYDKLEYIKEYWKIENVLLWHLVNRLRTLLYSVDLRISKWHGSGALGSYVYRTNRVSGHKADCGDIVYDVARYGYAGGRFERFHIGRYENVYGYDINSAYPKAISQLPSLSEGEWVHNDHPRKLVEFGIYRVKMRGPAITSKPGPLFHRDRRGNITFPHRLDGWYWAPELRAMRESMSDSKSIKVIEAWEYIGWTSRPFAFVEDMYYQRRDMKAAGIGAQIALKLCLNSLYGKMAQRAGWERTGCAPTWHQLEWAGWVTSYTRAHLFMLMAEIPYDQLIAVETDGIYSTATPDQLGLKQSDELGGWEITEYDELVYLQSGLYAKRQGKDWGLKYRGLDSDSVSVDMVVNHARALGPGTADWPKLVGTTTRFIGYPNALFREAQHRGPMKVHHCVWESEPKEVECGSVGKRIHSPKLCAACRAGATAYEMPHETIIKSRAMIGSTDEDYMCTQHDIPWLDEDKVTERFAWRAEEERQDGLIHGD